MRFNDKEVSVRRYRVADQIYDILKTQIIEGTLEPGEDILIDELVKKLDISKTPIRETLNRLHGEGLIVLTSLGKVNVVELSPRQISQICELRGALETLALKWGHKRIPRKKLEENLKMLQRAKKDMEENKFDRFREADSILHDLIMNSADNEWLYKVTSQIGILIDMTKNMYTSSDRYRKCLVTHIRMVECLLQGDLDSAIRNLLADIEHVKHQLVKSTRRKRNKD